MRRAERLFRLVQILRGQNLSRAEDLAASLEVSMSTIYRDVAHLQASGLPIVGEAGVGYLLRPGFDLPSMTFTHEQLDAIALGLAFVESSGDPNLSQAACEARAKIQASLPDHEEAKLHKAPFLSLANGRPAPPEVGLVRRAIRTRNIVSLRYKREDSLTSNRHVRPILVAHFPEGWMFSGWCELRMAFRTFRFDRIESMKQLSQNFEPEDGKDLSAFRALEQCTR